MGKDFKWTEIRLMQRSWFAAGRTFDFKCPRCGATSITMAEVCSADLADPCPGFEAIDAAHAEFEDNYHKITGADQ